MVLKAILLFSTVFNLYLGYHYGSTINYIVCVICAAVLGLVVYDDIRERSEDDDLYGPF